MIAFLGGAFIIAAFFFAICDAFEFLESEQRVSTVALAARDCLCGWKSRAKQTRWAKSYVGNLTLLTEKIQNVEIKIKSNDNFIYLKNW